jgi:iron complex outermembrane receptor protein
VFVRDYGQFDGSVAVNITPFAQVFVEGTNLFNAAMRADTPNFS